MQRKERTPQVVVVDTHPSILLSASLVLDLGGIPVIAAIPDLDLAIRLCEANRANVIAFDPYICDASSRATVAALRLRLPTVAIVVMSMQGAPAAAHAAITAGANAYVLKSQAETELATAVREALGGGVFVSPQVVAPAAARHAA
jgi:DNA-binding NarL/FixJ family response regulator